MENTMTREAIWKLWVDTQRRVVSFHEEAGSQLMEFRDRDMFCAALMATPPSCTGISDICEKSAIGALLLYLAG